MQTVFALSASSDRGFLNEALTVFQSSTPEALLITKLDEATALGPVMSLAIRSTLPIAYLSDGQRVPEDLHLADRAYLIDRAFKLKRDSAASQYSDAELPLLMANTGGAHNDVALREVHLG